MSVRTLKRNMITNQKINIVEIFRVANNIKSKSTKTDYSSQQEEVATFAQRTLREPVDITVFKKSEADKEFVKVMKVRTKGQLS